MSSEDLLTVADLSVRARTAAGPFDAVRAVNFSLPRSTSMALVGESGSGKTLTALAIAGLLGRNLTATGSARLAGDELIGMSSERRRTFAGNRIGFIFQEPMSSLHPILTVGAQMEEGLRAHYKWNARQRRDRVRELLSLVGLSNTRSIVNDRIGQLSGGMRQRVMIAMAISCEPEIVIADEPTTALDVTLQKQIIDLLLGLRDRFGLSLLMITHDLGVVSDTCDQAAVMYAGEVVERGPVRTLLSQPEHDYTYALLSSIPQLNDTRDRLPTVSTLAPWLADMRSLPETERPVTRFDDLGGGHWVQRYESEVSA